ncbi:BMP family ABC transporter substrate-binding protein [Granulicatella sp. zg-ZJ]|uniref:BMP family lipoprotein n=1 Tax=Granulicatella sp. zg-ZJ TaxID=2678504 RepID=UPI0013D4EB25|nr:BMP family ABC transporter substrate-binding protein [Granulicatella sp. zg-ZJ]NEW62689.1 BMP family ABC transporter substrate-binding protein [Granulicatella sp. zg-ZJ]
MSKRKVLGLVTMSAAAVLLLAACGNKSASNSMEKTTAGEKAAKKFSIVMVTDSGGVDDKSFNQSAWTAMQAWGKEHGREKGAEGYNYIQSSGEKDYATNFKKAVSAKYDLIFAVGFTLQEAANKATEENKDSHFVTVDSVIKDQYTNGASILFAENESAYLAGIAAAKTTKTNHIGYIGGVKTETLIRFEAGFVAGAKSVNKDITIDRQYVGSFQDAGTGKTIANTMFANGADVIYGAAGASGLGVFTAATDLMQADDSKQLWVIGVDLDQHEQGKYKTKSGEEKSVTLTSTLKKVGEAVVKFAEATEKDGFKSGLTRYTLADGGVDLTDGQLSADVKDAVKKAKQDIIDGKVKAPATEAELDEFLKK